MASTDASIEYFLDSCTWHWDLRECNFFERSCGKIVFASWDSNPLLRLKEPLTTTLMEISFSCLQKPQRLGQKNLEIIFLTVNTQKKFCCCMQTVLIKHSNFFAVLLNSVQNLAPLPLTAVNKKKFTRKTSNWGTQSNGPHKEGVTGLPVASSLSYIFIQTCVFLFVTLPTIN